MQALYECPGEDFAYMVVGVGDKMIRGASKSSAVYSWPPIDRQPVEQCDIVLQMLPCLILRRGARVAACSAIPGSSLRIRARLLGADREDENIYGYAFAAEVLEVPNYQNLVQRDLTLRLPYDLAHELIPELPDNPTAEEASSVDVSSFVSAEEPLVRTDAVTGFVPSEWLIDIKVQRSGALPLPIIYRKDIIRISLNLSDQTGGLVLGDYAPLINSRSHPNRVYTGTAPVAGCPHRDSNFHGNYFELAGLQDALPVTSSLATNFSEAHNTMLFTTDPDQVRAMRQSQQCSLR